jgi:uncharacterized membrane protein
MWLFVTIGAYTLSAFNSVVDKHLLGKKIPNPLVYSFYVGIFSIFVVALVPFGIKWPGLYQFGAAIFTGSVYLLALYFFFSALKSDEASRVVSIVGGVTPVFVLVLSTVIFGTLLTRVDLYAFALLVSGSVIISLRKSKTCGVFEFNKYSCVRSIEMAFLAALFFALFFVSAKFVFLNQPFISGFIWTRIGSFIAASAMLIFAVNRNIIFHTTKSVKAKSGGLFILNKIIAGVSFLVLNYAISIGEVALVNALEGFKYVLLLVMAVIFTKWFPHVIKEQFSVLIVLQKTLAVVLIFTGIFLLALS